MNRPLVLSILLTSTLIAAESPISKREAANVQEKISPTSECIHHGKTLAIAIATYASRHEGKLPVDLESLNKDGSLKDPVKTYTSPFDPKKDGCGYELLASGKSMSSVQDPARTPMLRARFVGPDGLRTVAFMDGHVEWIKDAP
jgi:prepilin-type processing-associated H-X9-DG protein